MLASRSSLKQGAWISANPIGTTHGLWLDDKMALLRVWETYVAPLKSYRGKDNIFLPFLQTLSSGTFNHFFHPQDSNPSEANLIQVDRRALADFAEYWGRLDPDLVSLPDLWREIFLGLRESGNWRRVKSLFGASRGRCFFRTDTGYMGLRPPGTEPGDLFVALHGGKALYILRPSPTHIHRNLYPRSCPRKYNFIGECYLHGAMDGEAIRAYKASGMIPYQFDLC
jgi:hypothetical protein